MRGTSRNASRVPTVVQGGMCAECGGICHFPTTTHCAAQPIPPLHPSSAGVRSFVAAASAALRSDAGRSVDSKMARIQLVDFAQHFRGERRQFENLDRFFYFLDVLEPWNLGMDVFVH